ncbi:MAG: AAA family ATPase, partial [Verrucomicrobiales bacterium]
MKENIIGRQAEQATLRRLLESEEPEFLAVFGRRRVGKTFLIKEFFEDRGYLFELTGEKDAQLAEQLQNFAFAFKKTFPDEPVPRVQSWREALQLLAETVDSRWRDGSKPVTIFFDELPWLASRGSRFLQALDHFWNSWGTRKSRLVLVVCGSAASWMISKLLHHKGGLYNRVTAQLRLVPYTLGECERYLKSRNVHLGRKDILELYMCVGGIPHYLRRIEPGRSVAQNIDRLCFSKDGLLRDEFDRLFASLFSGSEAHLSVIRALARKRCGISRDELIGVTKSKSGGGMTRVLKELEESGFLTVQPGFGLVSRGKLYRLSDEYSLFYISWLEARKGQSDGWLPSRNSRAWQAWAGFSFEGLCLRHVPQIKKALGIGGVSTQESGWFEVTEEGGAQIDLVLDRSDQCINLCEMKYASGEFVLTKGYAESLRQKLHRFQ